MPTENPICAKFIDIDIFWNLKSSVFIRNKYLFCFLWKEEINPLMTDISQVVKITEIITGYIFIFIYDDTQDKYIICITFISYRILLQTIIL